VIKPKVDPKIEQELRAEAREKMRLEEASKDLRCKVRTFFYVIKTHTSYVLAGLLEAQLFPFFYVYFCF
jgi:hypothetical protein